ncbi:MAG: phosphoribosylaminoimidazolesuccinocarboxamide synthase [Planctomycetota bacterium]|jgi:phosphoribosylaminoimidazole-succinocarboxamide synthase
MTTQTSEPELEAHLDGLHRLHRGKVRDIFAVDEHRMLLVATDRVSAFDVILPQRLADKGKVLTSLSKFWFDETGDLIPNHVIECDVNQMPDAIKAHANLLEGRSMLVHRAVPLKAEFIVRGYLAGSGWKEYQKSGEICGHKLPEGLKLADKLPEPILTPTTKAPAGEHDENITIPQLAHMVGPDVASKAGAEALALYDHAAAHAEERGILLADTKLEFGIFEGEVILIDEVFTPDSSRYWSKEQWEPGTQPDQYDKQIIRDALEKFDDWDKTPPAPELPQDVLDHARARYFEIHEKLTGKALDA